MAKRSVPATRAKLHPAAATTPPSDQQRKQLARALRDEKRVQQLARQLTRARRRTGEMLESLAATLPLPITLARGKKP